MKEIKKEYGFEGITIVPRSQSLVSSRSDCRTEFMIEDFHNGGYIKLEMPLFLSPMAFFTEEAIKKINNRFLAFLPRISPYQRTDEYNYSDIDSRIESCKKMKKQGYYFGVAVSMKENVDKIIELSKHSDFICVDVANGYMESLCEFIRFLKDKLKRYYGRDFSNLISGNVVDSVGFENLSQSGTDYVRLNIGGGSNCTTTDCTRIGRPLLSMLQEVYDYNVEKGKKSKIVLDGGVRTSGDLCLALLFADVVMTSYLFKGTELNIHYDERYYYKNKVLSYGMASAYVKDNVYVEGKHEFMDPYDFSSTYKQLKESLQSAMSYLNSFDLNEYKNSQYELIKKD